MRNKQLFAIKGTDFHLVRKVVHINLDILQDYLNMDRDQIKTWKYLGTVPTTIRPTVNELLKGCQYILDHGGEDYCGWDPGNLPIHDGKSFLQLIVLGMSGEDAAKLYIEERSKTIDSKIYIRKQRKWARKKED